MATLTMDAAGEEAVLDGLFPGFAVKRVGLADGSSMRVVTAGDGPVVLLIHGYPQTLCAWHLIAPRLAETHRVVAVDLPGYGGSVMAPGSLTVKEPSRRAIANALFETMDRLGHERFAVVGHDRGARAGYRMALDDESGRIDGFTSLTVIPTIEVWDRIDGAFALRAPHWFLFTQPAEMVERLLSHEPVQYLDSVLDTMAGGIHRLHPLALADYRTAFAKRSVREAIYRDYAAAMGADLEKERADRDAGVKLQCPVLCLWEDHAADPLPIWRNWAGDVSGAALRGGHLQPEIAADAVLAHLMPFLRRCRAIEPSTS